MSFWTIPVVPIRTRCGFLRVGVQAVGLPGSLSAFGVGDTLAEALDDLGEGIRALFSARPVPEELTREIAVTVDDAA
jgi:hypothetical protein